ncbi:hypothetical protein L1887_37771 [Cichorium endivia]|nr:hypothetical protein L1887_37771 [Cichorium endivia]
MSLMCSRWRKGEVVEGVDEERRRCGRKKMLDPYSIAAKWRKIYKSKLILLLFVCFLVPTISVKNQT